MTESRGSTDTREEQPGPAAAKKQGPVCYQLHEAGHFFTECSAEELRKTELRSDFPLSPTIVDCVSDGMYEGGTVARAGDAALPVNRTQAHCGCVRQEVDGSARQGF
ncbi:unnamed protein product [Heligmosomoides polygyrus]|uniref:CCHC-type domain-containing protein n=1 Tax=Heligmosomoides polygyrus TaxID=6339 RepID=A0A183F3M2_HELPZ|nr:unnamed protein product [Heligmosomoides polygyrus]